MTCIDCSRISLVSIIGHDGPVFIIRRCKDDCYCVQFMTGICDTVRLAKNTHRHERKDSFLRNTDIIFLLDQPNRASIDIEKGGDLVRRGIRGEFQSPM
jgi:hypothetical protein